MGFWVARIIWLLLIVAFLPLLVSGTAHLVGEGVSALGDWINRVFASFGMSVRSRVEGVVSLCLYLLAGLILIKFFLSRPKP